MELTVPAPSPPVLEPLPCGAMLDSRLAVLHPGEQWLAVADLHYGYEESQRALGSLFPLWGRDAARTRLLALVRDHHPAALIIAGDLLHTGINGDGAAALVAELQSLVPQVVLIRGNHDRNRTLAWQDTWTCGRWRFLHGHLPHPPFDGITLQGHLHPAWIWRDGAGTRIKLPALVTTPDRWILPAFSPWSAGTGWKSAPGDALYACHPTRILKPGSP